MTNLIPIFILLKIVAQKISQAVKLYHVIDKIFN